MHPRLVPTRRRQPAATPPPNTLYRSPDGEDTERLLDQLSAANRAHLAAAGIHPEVLRRLCRTQRGPRVVRRILAGHTDIAGPPTSAQTRGKQAARRERFIAYGHPDGPSARRTTGPWLLALAMATSGIFLSAALALLAGRTAILLGLALTSLLSAIAMLRTPASRGSSPAAALMTLAHLTLLFTVALNAGNWYMAIRGVETQGTIATPTYQTTHGITVVHCRITMRNGRTEQVETNNHACLDNIGTNTPIVYDPSRLIRPRLGTVSELNSGLGTGIAAGSAAVMTLTPAAVITAAARRRPFPPHPRRPHPDTATAPPPER